MFLPSFLVLMFLIGICLWFSRIFSQLRPRKCFRKILFMSGLVLCLVLSVLGSGLTTSFVLFLFSLFFYFERRRSGLTGHHTPPPRVVVFLSSVPAALSWLPVLAVRHFCSGVSLGCHSGPRAFFGFSRDCSEACFWTRG